MSLRYVHCSKCGADRPVGANCGACGYHPAKEKEERKQLKEAKKIVSELSKLTVGLVDSRLPDLIKRSRELKGWW